MKTRSLIFVGGLFLAVSFVYAVVAGLYFDDCGLSAAQAKDAVVEELVREALDQRYLSGSAVQNGTCSYSFDFQGQGRKLNYVVMSTWLHGVEVSVWDYQRDDLEHEKSGAKNH